MKRYNMYLPFICGAVLVLIPNPYVAAETLQYEIFGTIHVSLDEQDSANGAELHSNTSTFGIQGSRKLTKNDVEVIFKLEWQLEVTERNTEKALVDRDQWIGLKGSFGKLLIGTSTSNYKQTSSKVDPLWRTQLEGRSKLMAINSRQLSAGAGNDRGRLTNSINYTTPNFKGVELVANRTFSGNNNETIGVGIRYKTKRSLIFVDYFADNDVDGRSESAMKVGGYYQYGDWKFSGQLESSMDIDGSDYWLLGASYKVSQVGTIKFSTGEADGIRQSTSFAVLYDYSIGQNTNIYTGFGYRSDDINDDDKIFTIGARYRY